MNSKRPIPRTLFMLIGMLLLLSFNVSRASSVQHYFSATTTTTRRRRGFSSLWRARPVSYKSQYHAPIAGVTSDDEFYKERGYRPWRVDFAPKAPGHYSWTSRILMTNVFMYIAQIFSPSITQVRAVKAEISPCLLHSNFIVSRFFSKASSCQSRLCEGSNCGASSHLCFCTEAFLTF